MFPKKTQKAMILIGLALCMVASVNADLTNPYAPESTQEAVIRVADRLVAEQLLSGVWPSRGAAPAGAFTGSMAAGLVDAYRMTCTLAYKNAAVSAGNWILANRADCSFYYDEVYALMRLSETACDPADNTWRDALADFYGCVESQPLDTANGLAGTEWVIDWLEQTQGYPMVVLDVAHYTVAAYYVDTPDKEIWRDELIRLLEGVNDPYAEQVWMLGAATWALAQTGDLDATSCYVGSTLSDYGVATELQQLPPLLASYQVGPGVDYFHDHFLSIYNPPNDSFSGWTETNIYAAMGLAAADQYAGYDYRSRMDRLWAVNMQPVDSDGDVSHDATELPLIEDTEKYYHYAGEYLQYLAATRLPGDTNLDDAVDADDVLFFVNRWLTPIACDGCNRADFNQDGQVNLADFAIVGQGWLLSR